MGKKNTDAPGTLYVSPEGEAYRLDSAGEDPLTEKWGEAYSVLRVNGYSSRAESLPRGSVRVWSPEKGLEA